MIPLIKFDSSHKNAEQPYILGLGVFDGVHTGHRKIISTAADMAARCGAVPAAVTFSPHPREVLFPETPPQLLLPLEERCRLLRSAGAQEVGIISFDRQTADMDAMDFLNSLLHSDNFKLAGICVGSRWRFGRSGSGDQSVISRFAKENGLHFTPCQELDVEGRTVSSTGIRHCISSGDLELAEKMLGREVRLFGTVRHGNKIAGPVLRTPTANLDISFGILPPDGVYCGSVKVGEKCCPAAVNIGFSPTFNGNIRRVEAHLLDFDGNLYGEMLELELFSRLRDEKQFSSHEELMKQISLDVFQVKKTFEQKKGLPE